MMNSASNTNSESINIRIIATDLDGTLLDKNGQISQANMEAWIEARKRGIHVIPATGRTPGSLRVALDNSLSKLDFQSLYPGIYANGAWVLDPKGNVIIDATLSNDETKRIFDFFHSRNQMNRLTAYTTQSIQCLELNNHVLHAHTQYHEQMPVCVPELNDKYLKINFNGTLEELSECRAEITKYLDGFYICSAVPRILEVLRPNINKGIGLSQLCESLGIDRSQVAAIGDAENDLEMLKYAAYSFAVLNATDDVKKVVGCIVKHGHSDGFAEMVHRICRWHDIKSQRSH